MNARTIAKARGRLSGLAILLIAVLLGGCAYSCTLIGCMPGVTVDLTSLRASQLPAKVIVCVNGECQSSRVRKRTVATVNGLAQLEAGQPATVTLTMTGRDGKVLADAAITVVPEEIAPNGERCGPVCAVANVSLRDGELVR